jgi:hypothetical protein
MAVPAPLDGPGANVQPAEAGAEQAATEAASRPPPVIAAPRRNPRRLSAGPSGIGVGRSSRGDVVLMPPSSVSPRIVRCDLYPVLWGRSARYRCRASLADCGMPGPPAGGVARPSSVGGPPSAFGTPAKRDRALRLRLFAGGRRSAVQGAGPGSVESVTALVGLLRCLQAGRSDTAARAGVQKGRVRASVAAARPRTAGGSGHRSP